MTSRPRSSFTAARFALGSAVIRLAVLGLVAGTAVVDAASGLEIHVAPDGRDTQPGTREEPFASLGRAQQAVRQLAAGDRLPDGGVAVIIHAGIYELAAPLVFTAADGGEPGAPVTYQAAEGEEVRLVGGRVVTGWKPLADEELAARLPPEARPHVVCANLAELGLRDWEGIRGGQLYSSEPGLEVFFAGAPLTLARYPNRGSMHIAEVIDEAGVPRKGEAKTVAGRFVCDDPRPARWTAEPEVWLHGFWFIDWADIRLPMQDFDATTNVMTLGTKDGPVQHLVSGQWFFAQNVLAELDEPGEWYLDRVSGTLCLWPPGELRDDSVEVSVVRDMVRFEDASHVHLRRLFVEAGRGTGIRIRGGAGVRVVGCTVRNVGGWAVRVEGGAEHAIEGCDILGAGQGGIHLEGGDRRTLAIGGHRADNNHIHHIARWDPVYQSGINVLGVGNRVTHNLIHDVPHVAIGFTGNEQAIAFNEIHHAVTQANDAGAIYTSPRDETWSMRGNKIQFNYVHDIHGFRDKGCAGVYLDDCFSSARIADNVFENVSLGVLIGGGRDNSIANNIFMTCGKAVQIDGRGLTWAKHVGPEAARELEELRFREPPWSTLYPELVGILEDEPLAPKGNELRRNICVGGAWAEILPEAKPYVIERDNLVGEDPKFVARPPDDVTLAEDSPALALGFRQIPFRRIGLYPSADRASPVDAATRQPSRRGP